MQAAALVSAIFRVDILIDEVGSPLGKAEFEVAYCISALRAAAGVPCSLRGDIIPSDNPGRFQYGDQEPRAWSPPSPFQRAAAQANKHGAPCPWPVGMPWFCCLPSSLHRCRFGLPRPA